MHALLFTWVLEVQGGAIAHLCMLKLDNIKSEGLYKLL